MHHPRGCSYNLCPSPHSLLKVEIGSKVLEEDVHVLGVSKRKERDDVHQPLTDGWVGLHKWTLNVLQQYL